MERRMTRLLICRIAMVLAIGAAFCPSADAQDYVAPPVTISKDKVKIDGQVFYSHVVLEKQTLYSISKAYNVTIEDIYRYNPSVKENGLRKNDILNIPVIEVPQPKKEKRQAEAEVEVGPQPKALADHVAVSGDIKHTVKWYEDLASISQKYNVSQEAIMEANNLKDRKLKKRQILIIPGPDSIRNAIAEAEEPAAESEVQTDPESEEDYFETAAMSPAMAESDSLNSPDWWNPIFRRSVNATLIMPFKASGSTGNRNNMDFYSGVLLAARDLTDMGTDLHLNVYDIAEGVAGIPSDVLKTSDFIIGPIAPNDISGIAAIVQGSCPIVSPLDQRVEKLTGQHGNLIHAPSPQRAQFADIACWLKEDMQYGDRIIVISEKGARQNDGGRQLKAVIEQHSISYTPFSYSILEGRDIQSSLEAAMTSSGVNRVVIASESEAFVNDAVRNLNLILHNKFNVVLYAPAKIRTFETIEVENFHNTSLHASLTYNIDYDNKDVQDFIMKYRAMFGTEPTQFAFQGYDLTKYFVGIASRYQTGWMSHLTEEEAEMLQNTFRFNKNGDGGYTNSGIRRVIYDKGYSIVTVE